MSGVRKFAKIAMNLDAWTVAYVGGMTTKPTSAHIQLIDKFVKTTKSILSAKADVFYLGNINNSNDSYRNLIKDAHHGSIQGSDLVWDNLVGFTNPNGTGYVNTNYNPATQGVNYLLNNAGIGVNVTSSLNYSQDGQYYIGCQSSINNKIQLHKSSGNNGFYAYINSTLNYGLTGLPFSQGFFSANRTATNSCNSKNQNIVNSTSTVVSSAIPSHNIYIYGNNNAGTFDKPYTGGLNCVYIGASLTDAEYVTLNTAINEYLIGCLFLKYENDNWGVRMAKSYFYDLHGFEKYEAWEVYEFIKRHQPDYTYTPPELSINSGAPGLTDWIDSNADGLADGWSVTLNTSYPSVASIVTGNGFTGNTQRVVENNTSHMAYIAHGSINFIVGKTYQISGKYRCFGGLWVFLTSQGTVQTLTDNISNAVSFSVTFTCTTASYLMFLSTTGAVGNWFEIDEISVKEVTESDTVGFNKCLNSGFGLATDFVDSNADGLADNWVNSVNSSPSIVTGNGFTKNAQRLVKTVSSAALTLTQNQNLIVGRSYTLWLKYRSDITIAVYNNSMGSYGTIGTASDVVKEASITFIAASEQFYIGHSNTATTTWFEISEVLIIDNSNAQYLHNVFGPNGLNKIVADYILMLKSGGNTVTNNWIKTGVAARFCQDGSITNSILTMPAYNKKSNLGIFTITSIDGWNTYTRIENGQSYNSINSFYGNFPNILLLKTGGSKIRYNVSNCRCKANFNNQGFADKVYNFAISQFTYPGGINLNISELIGGSYGSVYLGFENGAGLWGYYGGDVTPLSVEFAGCSQLLITTSQNIYGSMKNWQLDSITSNLYINKTNISGGTSTWNKNITPTYFNSATFSTAAVNSQLKVINDYFALNTPVKNILINLAGSSMGIPTGGVNNSDLLGIVAKFAAVGLTASITVRTV